jgi:hypothetical protein
VGLRERIEYVLKHVDSVKLYESTDEVFHAEVLYPDGGWDHFSSNSTLGWLFHQIQDLLVCEPRAPGTTKKEKQGV